MLSVVAGGLWTLRRPGLIDVTQDMLKQISFKLKSQNIVTNKFSIEIY